MWRIGIIDDNEGESDDIQVSVLENNRDGDEITFKVYELAHRHRDNLLKEIIDDINDEFIHTLIVDYRLDTAEAVIKGWEIVDYVHNIAPEFPVIIMTNVPDESKESTYIDADKVYPKIIFLNTEHKDTSEMVKNIMLNIQRYVQRRKELEGKLASALNKYEQNNADETVIGEVLQVENMLGKYKETAQTILDQTFDMGELKDVLREIKEIEEKLEKR